MQIDLAKEIGMGKRTNTILQSAFLLLQGSPRRQTHFGRRTLQLILT